jgi:hypothetical protein
MYEPAMKYRDVIDTNIEGLDSEIRKYLSWSSDKKFVNLNQTEASDYNLKVEKKYWKSEDNFYMVFLAKIKFWTVWFNMEFSLDCS